MTEEDKDYVKSKIDSEGLDYTFRMYSDFKEIKDEEFHRLRNAYTKACEDLIEYLE
jgi:hypothetical protein